MLALRKYGGVIGRRSFATATKSKLAVLCVLDGWGYRPVFDSNSVLQGSTKNFDVNWGKAAQKNQITFLNACEEHVGLPAGQIGNSEVGHMNIGAGRVVYQDLMRINMSLAANNPPEKDAMKNNPALVSFANNVKSANGKVHLMGLLSPGGVHAMQDHISELANILATDFNLDVVLHAFTDGRDVPPRDTLAPHSLPAFISNLNSPKIKFGSVSGRYYAMDRDNRWERVSKAFDVIVHGQKGETPTYATVEECMKDNYSKDVTDEFIEPSVIEGYEGIAQGDGILMANYRADRAREILKAMLFPESIESKEVTFRDVKSRLSGALGLVKYSEEHEKHMEAMITDKDIPNPLGEVVANHGLSQLRIAETEKYPHVTFFFNGGRETPFDNEDRILVNSPKVATYDLQPEMSAPEVTDKLCAAIDSGKYNLVVINFANPDMVGHTGDLDAAIKAVEAVDKSLGRLLQSVEQQQGVALITADHGNCEQMWNYEINEPHTAHTLNKVPCMLLDYSASLGEFSLANDNNALCDLAPTVLQCLGLQQPSEMTGRSLINKSESYTT